MDKEGQVMARWLNYCYQRREIGRGQREEYVHQGSYQGLAQFGARGNHSVTSNWVDGTYYEGNLWKGENVEKIGPEMVVTLNGKIEGENQIRYVGMRTGY